jgi:hypothetical protein
MWIPQDCLLYTQKLCPYAARLALLAVIAMPGTAKRSDRKGEPATASSSPCLSFQSLAQPQAVCVRAIVNRVLCGRGPGACEAAAAL